MKLLLVSLVLLFELPMMGAGVKVRFDPQTPDVGPFPTDFLTAPATNTLTGRMVRMPMPDCGSQPNACYELSAINTLDGFNLQARIRVTFSGPIDVNTVKDGIFLVALENLTADEVGVHTVGAKVAINQIVYDKATTTVYAKPDVAMDQHRKYAVIVTAGVKDATGDPVGPDMGFTDCLNSGKDDYCKALAAAVNQAGQNPQVVGASVFTTLSATSWIEKARASLAGVAPAVRPTGAFPVVNVSDVVIAQWNRDLGNGRTDKFNIPTEVFSGIGKIAFGSYKSPYYIDQFNFIPNTPSGVTPQPFTQTNEVFYNAYVPADPKPATGYPVVIFAHSLGDSRLGGPTLVAPAFNAAGVVVIAINAVGHGYGGGSNVTLTTLAGQTRVVPTPGRGIPAPNGTMGAESGCMVIGLISVGLRDCLRQTVVDLAQLVRAIQAGIDVDGDGQPDLDPSKIYFAGHSLGALAGAMLLAVEPNISAGALLAGGGSVVDVVRWSPEYKPLLVPLMANRMPPLVNDANGFNENYVLRDQPPLVNDVQGAIAIQNVLENLEWLQAGGDPLSYAVHLKPSPLGGMTPRQVLFQIPLGDQTIPNPAETALVRESNMKDSTWVYRHDLAYAAFPSVGVNPHAYLFNIQTFAGIPIALAAQQQVVEFLTLGSFADPNSVVSVLFGNNLFEQPGKLPETLNFIQ